MKRKEAIYLFCVKGLIPFIESQNYRLVFEDAKFVRVVLRLLFTLYTGKQVCPYLVDIPHHDEHYDYYEFLFDEIAWQDLWSHWGDIQDFDQDAYGYPFRQQIHQFIWSWIDFDKSKTIQRVEKQLEALEDEEEFSKGKEDPYLQENTKRDYSDRHYVT